MKRIKLQALRIEDTQYQVDIVESGNKAIESVISTTSDLVFLDLTMPGLNGVETLMELRKRDVKVPVYFVTAFHKEFLNPLKSAEKKGNENFLS